MSNNNFTKIFSSQYFMLLLSKLAACTSSTVLIYCSTHYVLCKVVLVVYTYICTFKWQYNYVVQYKLMVNNMLVTKSFYCFNTLVTAFAGMLLDHSNRNLYHPFIKHLEDHVQFMHIILLSTYCMYVFSHCYHLLYSL